MLTFNVYIFFWIITYILSICFVPQIFQRLIEDDSSGFSVPDMSCGLNIELEKTVHI